jgi:hypothetical protein
LPVTKAATSVVTSQLSVTLRDLPVETASVGVATNAPPGVHGVFPSLVAQVTPLPVLPVPSIQLAVSAWTL